MWVTHFPLGKGSSRTLNAASGAEALKCALSDREEEGGWLPAGIPVEPLSDSFGVGGKGRGDSCQKLEGR